MWVGGGSRSNSTKVEAFGCDERGHAGGRSEDKVFARRVWTIRCGDTDGKPKEEEEEGSPSNSINTHTFLYFWIQSSLIFI